MSNKSPKPLADLIGQPGSALHELARQARERQDLGARLREGLAPELAGGLVSAGIHADGTLVVLAASPAWAARLRFEESRLIDLCAGSCPAATRLRVRVATPAP